MNKYRPCPSIIAMFTSDSQHPPRSKHAVYLVIPEVLKVQDLGSFERSPMEKTVLVLRCILIMVPLEL